MRPFRIALLAASFALPAAADAQGSPWAPWFGCWSQAPGRDAVPTTCVVPSTDPRAAEFITVEQGEIKKRATIIADGVPHPTTTAGCTGNERANFSGDGARVYLSADVTCGASRAQRNSSILSISELGEFVEAQGMRVGEQRQVATRRHRALREIDLMPAEIQRALEVVMAGTASARVAAAVPTDLKVVREAAGLADEAVVEAWLVESSRDAQSRLRVNAKAIQELDAAKVPSRVIDVVVALGYPDAFQVAVGPNGLSSVTEAERMATTRRASSYDADLFAYSPFGYSTGWYRPACLWSGWGMSSYGIYGMYDADLLRCSSYGYYPYNYYGGWGTSPWGYGGPITVVVRPVPTTPADPGRRNGRVVKGSGYTHDQGSTGSTAQPRVRENTASSGGRASTPSSSSGSSGSSSSSSSSSGSSSSGSTRTAKPRSP